MTTITQADLAWMAAIVDLKALLLTKTNSQRATPQLVLQVDTRNLQIARRMCDLTEVMPDDKRSPRMPYFQRACKDHCPEPHIHHEEDWHMPATSRWAVTGIAAAIVLYNIKPYMVRWDEDFTTFQKNCIANAKFSGQGYGQTLAAIRRLLSRGWTLPSEILDHLVTSDVPGGRALSIRLKCGHERPQGRLLKGRVWCQQCEEYQLIKRGR